MNRELLSKIPQVEQLLSDPAVVPHVERIGHAVARNIIRRVVEECRARLVSGEITALDGIAEMIIAECRAKNSEKLQRVINGTGVLIHTNLGRAPIQGEILNTLAETMTGYCNIEYHIPSGKRGKRGGYSEELIAELSGAEDALIVNNNASSVFLILSAFARGKEVIVSRGELIQIGGGFRIPDIMRETGALLREVGTTNITTTEDYASAVTENSAMILSAHRSNFRIEGFTETPGLRELAALKHERILLVRDMGSGNMVADDRLPKPFEATVKSELAQGADLVCFSGDKLLGASQAGIIVGRSDLVSSLRKHTLMRMIRVDKITYYIIQETLRMYERGSFHELPVWKMILKSPDEIKKMINRLFRLLKNHPVKKHIARVSMKSTFGGGAMPAREFDSMGIRFDIPGLKPEELFDHFLNREVPLLGVIIDDAFHINFMTLFELDLPEIADAILEIDTGTAAQ